MYYHKSKCLCISVERICLALGIFSAVVSGMFLLGSIIIGLLIVTGIINVSNTTYIDNIRFDYIGDSDLSIPIEREISMTVTGFDPKILIPEVAVLSLVTFIFSVLLCNGICKHRPGQVMAYFVYGVVITMIAVLAAGYDMFVSYQPVPDLQVLAGCVIYSLFLMLVHKTYCDLIKGASYKKQNFLVET